MNWLAENGERVLAVLGALYALALVITKLTPTPKDDEVLSKIHAGALAVGKLFGLRVPEAPAAKAPEITPEETSA